MSILCSIIFRRMTKHCRHHHGDPCPRCCVCLISTENMVDLLSFPELHGGISHTAKQCSQCTGVGNPGSALELGTPVSCAPLAATSRLCKRPGAPCVRIVCVTALSCRAGPLCPRAAGFCSADRERSVMWFSVQTSACLCDGQWFGKRYMQ